MKVSPRAKASLDHELGMNHRGSASIAETHWSRRMFGILNVLYDGLGDPNIAPVPSLNVTSRQDWLGKKRAAAGSMSTERTQTQD